MTAEIPKILPTDAHEALDTPAAPPLAETAITTSGRDAFYIDDTPLWEFPGIRRLAELNTPDPYGLNAEADREDPSPTLSRAGRRDAQAMVVPALNKLCEAIATQLYKEGRFDNLREATRDILAPYAFPGVEREPFMRDMCLNVEGMMRFGVDVRDQTLATIGELDPLVKDNPVAQYELSKLYIGEDPKDEPSPRSILRKMAISMELVGSGSALNPSSLADRLSNGEFDRYIATDVLEYEPSQDERVNLLYEKIKALESFSQTINPELSTDELRHRLVDNVAAWPEPQLQALVKIRNDLVNRLNIKIGFTTNKQLSANVKQPSAVEQAVARVRDAIYYDYAGNRRPRQVNAKRKSRTRREETKPKESAIVSPEQENTVIRPVSYINAAGEQFASDSDEFVEFKNEYLKRFRGAKGLPADLDAAIDYLSKLRMDTGQPNGVNQYGAKLARDGEEYDLLALKPSDAPGFPSQSKITKETRILFSLGEDGGVLLHAIARRPEVERIVRGLVAAGKNHR